MISYFWFRHIALKAERASKMNEENEQFMRLRREQTQKALQEAAREEVNINLDDGPPMPCFSTVPSRLICKVVSRSPRTSKSTTSEEVYSNARSSHDDSTLAADVLHVIVPSRRTHMKAKSRRCNGAPRRRCWRRAALTERSRSGTTTTIT